MKSSVRREVRRNFREQHAHVSSRQLRALGVSSAQEGARVASGEWEKPYSKVVRLAAAPTTEEGRLMAAVLAAGPLAMASHQSAAWMWGLSAAPARHSVIVGRGRKVRISGFDVHHPSGPLPKPSARSRIPCTNPLRTVLDLAAVAEVDQLDDAIDRALATGLATVDALQAELEREGRSGRRGAGRLRQALRRRGMIEPSEPSVLMSKVLRLLHLAGIEVEGAEVVAGADGRYRLDVVVRGKVALEVDGYAYHHSAEAKGDDDRRRNRLRLQGFTVLVYDWKAVTMDAGRILAECRQALDQAAGARPPVAVRR